MRTCLFVFFLTLNVVVSVDAAPSHMAGEGVAFLAKSRGFDLAAFQLRPHMQTTKPLAFLRVASQVFCLKNLKLREEPNGEVLLNARLCLASKRGESETALTATGLFTGSLSPLIMSHGERTLSAQFSIGGQKWYFFAHLTVGRPSLLGPLGRTDYSMKRKINSPGAGPMAPAKFLK